jgi:hypothetical protein
MMEFTARNWLPEFTSFRARISTIGLLGDRAIVWIETASKTAGNGGAIAGKTATKPTATGIVAKTGGKPIAIAGKTDGKPIETAIAARTGEKRTAIAGRIEEKAIAKVPLARATNHPARAGAKTTGINFKKRNPASLRSRSSLRVVKKKCGASRSALFPALEEGRPMKNIRLISLAAIPAVAFSILMLASPKDDKAEAAGPLQRFGFRTSPRERDRQLLEAVGSLAASHYYQAYLNIGFLADGKAQGLFKEREAGHVLDSVLSLLATVDKQLDTVSKLDLEKDDQTSVDQMRKISSLLRDQGKELQSFWESGNVDRSDDYEDLRQKSWTGISRLLGLGR